MQQLLFKFFQDLRRKHINKFSKTSIIYSSKSVSCRIGYKVILILMICKMVFHYLHMVDTKHSCQTCKFENVIVIKLEQILDFTPRDEPGGLYDCTKLHNWVDHKMDFCLYFGRITWGYWPLANIPNVQP